ncbi:MAG TPA: hypothetical protein VER83_10360, partial [Candidatus Nanopelagicales bacterium]|nr:hypothetical protein [Candidatus Nanopelagicales bacterium]
MSKMTGVFRPQPKISEAELAIARERTAARLEDLFGRRDGSAEHAGQIPLQRPPIIVEEGSDLIGLPSEHDTEARFDVHEDPAPAEVIAFMESPSATPELVTVVVAPTPDAELVGVMEHPALLEPMAPGSEAGAGPAPDDADVVSPSIVEDPVDLAPGSASGTQMTLGAGPPEPTGPLAAAVDPVDQLAARDVREDATTAPSPVAHQARVVTGAEASDRSGRVAVDEAAAYREALRQAFWYAAPLTPARAIAPPAAHPRTTPMTPTPTPTTPPQNDAANGAVASPQVTPDREPAELVPAVTIASEPVAPSADPAVRQDETASAPDAPVESLVASPVKAARASRTAGPRRARLAPTTARPPEERPPTAPPPKAAAPPPEV